MHRTASLLPVLLLPIAALGAEVYVPKMGIRLQGLPQDVTASRLVENLDADEVTVHVGAVELSVMRLEAAVPAGVALADGSFRQALADDFGDDAGAKDPGEATSISGNAAWTWSRTRHPFSMPVVEYTVVTYVIANAHAYRLRVHDWGTFKPDEPARPADLQAVLSALPETTFEPVTPAAPAPDARLKIPRMAARYYELYPDAAWLRKEEGVVDIELSIDGKGHATDVRQTYAAFAGLGTRIPVYLKNATFRVPADWEANGHPSARFDVEFQFALSNSAHGCRWPAETRVPGATVVSVCSAH